METFLDVCGLFYSQRGLLCAVCIALHWTLIVACACRYFSFDEHCFVVRELLGKKLSSRLRNNLDDIADKTGVPLKSCRRQVSGCSHDCMLKVLGFVS